ncbi:hypothetical protein [Actinoplanes campanulatus]|uniref:hypothetical protein n=1 Tax=Actinoplanes campanulatus TaxID=113559 RepID=UPI001C841A4A|nr:hypothetical protein [Actinoplanes campanulatus]
MSDSRRVPRPVTVVNRDQPPTRRDRRRGRKWARRLPGEHGRDHSPSVTGGT